MSGNKKNVYSTFLRKKNKLRKISPVVVVHAFTPTLERQRQVELCDPAWAIDPVLGQPELK